MEIAEFFVTQILREIKEGESRVSKSAILSHLGTLKFDIHEFWQFFKAVYYQINENAKNGSFKTCRFSKFDFT